MQVVKQTFRRMNLDADVRSLQPGEYRRLVNGIPITPRTEIAGFDGVIQNFLATQGVSNADLEATSKIIGGCEDRAGGRYFFAAYHDGGNHTIYAYIASSNAIVTVMRTSLFDFASSDFVDMDIVGDILVFTNGRGEIKKINVDSAIAGGVYTPTLEEITLIKRPPQVKLGVTVSYQKSYKNNYLFGHYFQFYHRFLYEDGDYSVFGPSSVVTDAWIIPTTTVDVVSTSNLGLTGGATIDDKVMSNGERVLAVGQSAATENGIYEVNTAGAWSRATDADSSGELLALTVFVKSGNLLSGIIYQNTNESAITIGATNITFARISGPNLITVGLTTSDIPATVQAVEFAVRIDNSNELIVYRKETPAFSSTHSFYNDSYLFSVADAQALKFSDAIPKTCKTLKFFKNRLFLANNLEGYTHTATTAITLSLGTIAVTDNNAIRHHKDGATYKVCLMFHDENGRHSGVQSSASISIPERDPLSATTFYKITADLSSIPQSDIPLWATDFSVMVTAVTNKSFFLKYQAADIFYYKVATDGTVTYTKTFSGDLTGTVLLISNFVNEKIGYTFNQGDRVRIFRGSATPDLGVDTEIIGQDGPFIQLRLLPEYTSYLLASNNNSVVIEIYTPRKNTVEPFFEGGSRYSITSPGTGSRAFSTTNPDVPFDVSSVKRHLYVKTSTYSATDPSSNQYIRSGTERIYFEAMNTWDDEFETWVHSVGKSIVLDGNDSLEIQKGRSIKFGGIINLESNVFGGNVFNALDEYALPVENGEGTRLMEAGDVLVAVMSVEHVAIYIGEGFVNTSDGNQFLAKTDSVIGDDRRYLGGFGSTVPKSVVSRDGRVYSLDLQKGAVIRRSQDGLTVISDYGVRVYIAEICKWYRDTFPGLGEDLNIVGGWNPVYECYLLSFYDPNFIEGQNTLWTMLFHEKTNSWVCFRRADPEFLGTIGDRGVYFKGGAFATDGTLESSRNFFFASRRDRELHIELAPGESLEKIWRAMEMDIDTPYDTLGANEVVVELYYNSTDSDPKARINYLDFQQRASTWWSSFFRVLDDQNFSSETESKYKSSQSPRSQSVFLRVVHNGTQRNPMKSISVFFEPSRQSFP